MLTPFWVFPPAYWPCPERQINCKWLWQIWVSPLKIPKAMQNRFRSQARANWLGREMFLQCS